MNLLKLIKFLRIFIKYMFVIVFLVQINMDRICNLLRTPIFKNIYNNNFLSIKKLSNHSGRLSEN